MIKPQDYTPSMQVQQLINMVIEYRYHEHSTWCDQGEKRFTDGARHGLNIAFRALVVRETEIADPEVLDELCADLIESAKENRS